MVVLFLRIFAKRLGFLSGVHATLLSLYNREESRGYWEGSEDEGSARRPHQGDSTANPEETPGGIQSIATKLSLETKPSCAETSGTVAVGHDVAKSGKKRSGKSN